MAWGDSSGKTYRVGTFVLDGPKEYRRSYETASWWTAIEVPAGEYEIRTNGYWCFIELPGTVVDEHIVNRIGAHTSLAEKREIGKATSHTIQAYGYDLAKLFATDPEHYRMDDDWNVEVTQWGGEGDTLSNGKRRARFSLVPPPTVNTLILVQDRWNDCRVYDKRTRTNVLEHVTYGEASQYIRDHNPEVTA